MVSAKSGGRYTLTIYSKTKSTEDALADFTGAQRLAAHGKDESDRRARISMSELSDVIAVLDGYVSVTRKT